MYIKIYLGKVANANKTLKKSIKIQDLILRINDNYLISRLREFNKYDEINLWDLGKKAITKIKIGENLAISCEDYIYIGEIIGTIDDKKGEIGDIVGWAKQFKKPWSNVIILKNVKIFSQNETIYGFIQDNNRDPYKLFRNLLKIGKNEEEQLNNLLNIKPQQEQGRYSQYNKTYLPKWIKVMIEDIKKLKKYSSHHERSHESLIERFFENIGYKRFIDIKFRVGRIDIAVLIDERPAIVIEVKRYWNLNVKNDQNVIQQAYNYALRNGARFVIISNGDYYAVFDRDRGRTYKENLMGDYRLTNIQKNDLTLINFLKKDNLIKYN